MRAPSACVLAGLAALACAAEAPAQLRTQLVTNGVQDPAFVAAPIGDYKRLFISSQHGTIRIVRNGALLPRAFADLSAEVRSPADSSGGYEQGLASFAFAPDYERSGFLYVAYTDRQGDVRIEELRRSPADPDVADPAYRRLLLEVPHREAPSHNGGQLQFGPDGYLYVSLGDSGTSERIVLHAQNLNLLLGKLLRIDPRPGPAGAPYRIPPDNPFIGDYPRPEIWAYGLRNPYRFSFDRATGDLTLADVGHDAAEEVDFAPLGRGSGANYGWPYREGHHAGLPGPGAGTVAPVLEQPHSAGFCAVTGGYVVRDRSLGSIYGDYIYSDLCSPQIRAARLREPDAINDRVLGPAIFGLSSFGEDAAGCVYATSVQDAVYLLSSASSKSFPCRDRFAPRLRARAAKRQRALRKGRVTALARCDERCSVSATGQLRVGDEKKRIKLRGARRLSAFGQTVALKLKLSPGARRAAQRGLRRRQRVTVRVVVRARDGSGNRSKRARRRVRVRR